MELLLINLQNQELLLSVEFGVQLIQKAKKEILIHTTTKLLQLKIKLKKQLEDGKLFTILEMNLSNPLEANNNKKMLNLLCFHGIKLSQPKKMLEVF